MRRLVDLQVLHRLDSLIRLKATGKPDDLANRLGVSRTSLFEMIAFLKSVMLAPISYSNTRKSYVYDFPPKFYLGFDRDNLALEETVNVYGGGCVHCNQAAKAEAGKKKEKKFTEVDEYDDDAGYIFKENIDFNNL